MSINNKKHVALLLALVLLAGLLSGCGIAQPSSAEQEAFFEIESGEIPLAAGADASMLGAVAAGTSVQQNDKAILDYSNTADGYVMVKYLGSNQKVKTRITGPSGVNYDYNQSLSGEYDTFVLSDGNGSYKISVYENIKGTSYSVAFTHSFTVALKDEFAPFLRSNKYVNYSAASKVVAKAAELCKDQAEINGKIKAVYEYVISNFTYDYELAKTVTSGYIPDLDGLLQKKSGICFDYAAVMTAMLRSQNIPTKMVFGYAGKVYHAWISAYSSESGWITAAIYFDGKDWKLMDPTFAANGKSSAEIMNYIGNGANYTAKYTY